MRILTVCLIVLATALPATAQETREAELARAQAEKAATLRPYAPNRAEKAIALVGRAFMGPPTGPYPWLGSIYPGGLFAIGPGYRRPFGGGGVFDAQGAISFKRYTLLRATLQAPPLADRRVKLFFYGEAIDARSVVFYGVGNDTQAIDRSNYRYQPRTIGTRFTFAPAREFDLGGSVGYLDISTDRGLAPAYRFSQAHAAYDWREAPGYSRSGGYYRVDWSHYDQREGAGLSFKQVHADVRQLIPLVRGNWVIALRMTTSMTYTRGDNAVPFFLMPQLGGGSDLRGYPSWRFRDRNKILVSGEFRWTPSHFVDMAIFHDAGKVTASKADLSLLGLRHTTGVGIRFHTPAATFLRIEYARGAAGGALIFAGGPSF